MIRRTLITILALVMMAAFAAPAFADSYKLVNQTGHSLKIQSKALKFVQPAEAKPAFFDMGNDQTKTVEFGNDFRLWFLHIYNKDDMSQNHQWDRHPNPADSNQAWTVTVTIENDKMDANIVKN